MMHRCSWTAAAAVVLAMAQTPATAAPAPSKEQQDFCNLVQRLRSATAGSDAAGRQAALATARSEAEAFIEKHRGIDWIGPVGRIVFSQTDKAAGEVEACPSTWIGGLSPEGVLDSDTWAEPATRLFDILHGLKQGQRVEFRAALLGVYDRQLDFPAKIWVRARIVDITPLP